LLVLTCLTLSPLVGCTPASTTTTDSTPAGTPPARDGLIDLAQLLKSIKDQGGRLPATPAEFAAYDVAFPAAGALVQNGTIVHLRGATLDEADDELKLVAMQAGADQTGGWVLLSNGEVSELTAEQVTALPRAGTGK
jgi:hypothetical protein